MRQELLTSERVSQERYRRRVADSSASVREALSRITEQIEGVPHGR